MPVKKVVIEKADRVYQLPPPLFTSLHKERDKTLLKKTDILNFAKFSWSVPTESELVLDAQGLRPAEDSKLQTLKEELSRWFEKHQGVQLRPDKEVYLGSGIRNLILNIGLAFIDRGELVFVPELGYPHYRRTVAACGGDSVNYGVSTKSDWWPDFKNVLSPIGRIARMLFLNSPHNPTGVVLEDKELNQLITIASKENVMIINDAAYQSLNESKTMSFLSAKGGQKTGVEIHSFSYTFGLPSLPFGFVAGHSEIINGLNQISQLSPQPILNFYCDLAIAAIRKFPNESLKKVRRQISSSRAEAVKLIDLLNLEQSGRHSAPFVWAKISGRRRSATAANILYHAGKIVAVPGTEFGESGEGYLRFSLTVPPETYIAARERISRRKRLFSLTED